MASNDGSAPGADRQASPELQEVAETILVADKEAVFRSRLALKTWRGEVNQIREDCLTSLGHSITDESGARRTVIALTWGCMTSPKSWKRQFQIVTESSHPIMLGLEASELAADAKRGKQAFPAFSRRLKKDAKEKREAERKAYRILTELEINQEAQEKLEKIHLQRQQQPNDPKL